VHLAIHPVSEAHEGSQGDRSIRLCLFQLAYALRGHAQAVTKSFRTHAQRQPDGLGPTAPRCGVEPQFGELAELAVQFCQAGEVQAGFQGSL